MKKRKTFRRKPFYRRWYDRGRILLLPRQDRFEHSVAMAERMEARKRWDRASLQWNRALECAPEEQRQFLQLRYIECLLRTRRFNKARRLIARWQKQASRQPDFVAHCRALISFEEQIASAHRLRREGLHAQAQRHYHALLERHPDRRRWLFNLGRLEWEQRNTSEALRWLDRMEEEFPEDTEALYLKASIHQRERNWPALLEISNHQADAILARYLATAAFAMKDYPLAAGHYVSGLRSFQPLAVQQHKEIAFLFEPHSGLSSEEKQDLRHAYRIYQKMRSRNKRRKTLEHTLAKRFYQLMDHHRLNDAARCVEGLLRLSPQHYDYHMMRCRYYRAREQWQDLLNCALKQTRRVPRKLQAYRYAADAYYYLGQEKKGRRLLFYVVLFSRGQPMRWNELAGYCVKAEYFKTAECIAKYLIRREPDKDIHWRQLFRVYTTQARMEKLYRTTSAYLKSYVPNRVGLQSHLQACIHTGRRLEVHNTAMEIARLEPLDKQSAITAMRTARRLNMEGALQKLEENLDHHQARSTLSLHPAIEEMRHYIRHFHASYQ